MTNPFDPGYFTEDDLAAMGFKMVGKNVRIARNNTIIGLPNISIGDNVRIDGYCAIIASGSGWVDIKSFVHIGGWCYLAGGSGIQLEDFSGVSQGARIYSRADDFSGEYLTNPTVPERYTGIQSGTVRLGKHALIGSGTVVLPQVTIGEGAAVGALSLVKNDLDPWGVYFGCPARRLRARSKRILQLEADLLRDRLDPCDPDGVSPGRRP